MITLALMLMLGLWAGYRLATWWARRSLDRVIAERMATQGWQPSPEFLAMLRRPTVDGVARRTLRKMGLAAYADVLLGGTPITLVCHNKALLQRAVSGIIKEKDAIEGHMEQALLDAQAEAALASLKAKPSATVKTLGDDRSGGPSAEGITTFHAPPLPEPKVSAQPFTVIEGGKK